MSCKKCIGGNIYHCSNCGQVASEYCGDDGGMIYCDSCDILGEDYSILSMPCPDCANKPLVLKNELTETKDWGYSKEINEIITTYYNIKDWGCLAYFSILYKGNKHLISPTGVSDHIIKAYCYIENIETEFQISKLTNVEKVEGHYWYKYKTSGYPPNLSLLKTFSFSRVSIELNDESLIRLQFWGKSWPVSSFSSINQANFTEENNASITISIFQLKHRSEEDIKYNLTGNYICLFCHKRKEKRIYFIDRIDSLEYLW